MERLGPYDLHAHTTISDGKLSPTELVRLAKAQDLKALAITDHDTVEGVAEAKGEADGLSLEIVAGVEVSAHFGDAPVHILGLFVDELDPELNDFFVQAKRRRVDRVRLMCQKLRKLGLDIDADAVFAKSSHGTVGRPHVAEVLIESGQAADIPDAFGRFLGDGGPAYVGYEKVTLDNAIDLIRRAGGIASLAHPGLLVDDTPIPDMAAGGLHALEVYHCDHTSEKIARYERLVEELGLLRTGGSDFHRQLGDDPPRLGCSELTEEAFEKLRAAAQ
jgi:predicted metal-dependent phosphoesterase TrpH